MHFCGSLPAPAVFTFLSLLFLSRGRRRPPPPHLFGALNFENCTAKMYANQILPPRTAYGGASGTTE